MKPWTESASIIMPDWPAPAKVKAASTTRLGGVSRGVFESFNLGDHVGDDLICVENNRQLLQDQLGLTIEPVWLKQIHGNTVIDAAQSLQKTAADAAYAQQENVVCAVMTADCLPILLCDQQATCVAAIHGGWRGLANGIIANTVNYLNTFCEPSDLMAWLGPAIGPDVFEVGDEVRSAFIALDNDNEECFRPSPQGRWLADIYALAKLQLQHFGIEKIYGGGYCTVNNEECFFSYRRDGQCGRMANLIWLTD